METATFLTRDNLHLSRATEWATSQLSQFGATGCTESLPSAVADYVRQSLAENTLRAYRSDLAHFIAWGGAIPAPDRLLAIYLAAHAAALSVATLTRRLATISRAHEAIGAANPVRSALVRATMRGIRRSKGTAQVQAKPLLRSDLFNVLAAMGNTLKDARDRALLLVGFAGGFRRSELVAIDRVDIEHVREGIVINIRRSKTDQLGAGRKIGIPLGRTPWCAVQELENWLSKGGIGDGAVFRRVDQQGSVSQDRLSAEAVSIVLRARIAAAGFNPGGYSGHSLRAGFVTSAIQAGVSSWKIRQQTGHKSEAMLGRYVRDSQLFVGSAAASIL